jgi:hypothetical protein
MAGPHVCNRQQRAESVSSLFPPQYSHFQRLYTIFSQLGDLRWINEAFQGIGQGRPQNFTKAMMNFRVNSSVTMCADSSSSRGSAIDPYLHLRLCATVNEMSLIGCMMHAGCVFSD